MCTRGAQTRPLIIPNPPLPRTRGALATALAAPFASAAPFALALAAPLDFGGIAPTRVVSLNCLVEVVQLFHDERQYLGLRRQPGGEVRDLLAEEADLAHAVEVASARQALQRPVHRSAESAKRTRNVHADAKDSEFIEPRNLK